MDIGTEAKHLESHSSDKFEELVQLVGLL